jgi:tRNA(fMet)-specific endonuclease VapC
MYLIDSDILIYGLKKHPLVQQRFQEKSSLPKSISVITYGELYYGAKKSVHVEKNLAVVRRISELFPIINTTKSIMETFADLKTGLQSKGNMIADLPYNLSCFVNNKYRNKIMKKQSLFMKSRY